MIKNVVVEYKQRILTYMSMPCMVEMFVKKLHRVKYVIVKIALLIVKDIGGILVIVIKLVGGV